AGLGLMLVPTRSQAFIFDGFNGPLINHTIWHGFEGFSSGVADTEALRTLKNGQLDLALRSFGATSSNSGASNGRFGLSLNNPGGLSLLFVQVTVHQFIDQACAANPTSTRPRARVIASFFNDGSSTGAGDETGDILGIIQMVQDSNSGPEISMDVVRCSDPKCNNSTDVGTGFFTFVKKWALDVPHTLLLFWDNPNNQITGIVDFNTAGQEQHSISYAPLSDGAAPGFDFKDFRIQNFIANCTPGAVEGSMGAFLENFFAQEVLRADPAVLDAVPGSRRPGVGGVVRLIEEAERGAIAEPAVRHHHAADHLCPSAYHLAPGKASPWRRPMPFRCNTVTRPRQQSRAQLGGAVALIHAVIAGTTSASRP